MKFVMLVLMFCVIGCATKPFKVVCEEKDVIKNMCRHPKFVEEGVK